MTHAKGINNLTAPPCLSRLDGMGGELHKEYHRDPEEWSQAAEKGPSTALPLSFVVAAYIQVRLTPQDFGRPRKRDFADSTCICLPARSPALRGEGRGVFEQP
jgi:hypothetical protein